ncbi:hypothetical protein SAMN06272721_11381 [Arthrobacter sp. P2b]|nr:hypothetical protein SAMN06272721_11381 [Arthrobacter sp. P2b]
MQEAMIEAEPGLPAAEAAIRAFVDYLTGGPRRAKIFLMEAGVLLVEAEIIRDLDTSRQIKPLTLDSRHRHQLNTSSCGNQSANIS